MSTKLIVGLIGVAVLLLALSTTLASIFVICVSLCVTLWNELDDVVQQAITGICSVLWADARPLLQHDLEEIIEFIIEISKTLFNLLLTPLAYFPRPTNEVFYNDPNRRQQLALSLPLPVTLIDLIYEYTQARLITGGHVNKYNMFITDDFILYFLDEHKDVVPRSAMFLDRVAFQPTIIGPYLFGPEQKYMYGFAGSVGPRLVPATANGRRIRDMVWIQNDVVIMAVDRVHMNPSEEPVRIPMKDVICFREMRDEIKGQENVIFTMLYRYQTGHVFVMITRRPDFMYSKSEYEVPAVVRPISVAFSSDMLFILTHENRILQRLLKEPAQVYSRFMPATVSTIVSVLNRTTKRTECVALVTNGTLWKLDAEHSVRLPTFDTDRPDDAGVDDLFSLGDRYCIVRYKNFTMKVCQGSEL